MADRIKVSTGEMRQAVSEYTSAHETMDQAFKHMEAALERLHGCWDGPAKSVFRAKWAAIYRNITRSDAVIEKSIRALNGTIVTMEAGEDAVGATAQSLPIGTTPPMF